MDRAFETNIQGATKLSGLAMGRYKLQVSKAGFETQTVLINISNGEPVVRTITLEVGGASFSTNGGAAGAGSGLFGAAGGRIPVSQDWGVIGDVTGRGGAVAGTVVGKARPVQVTGGTTCYRSGIAAGDGRRGGSEEVGGDPRSSQPLLV